MPLETPRLDRKTLAAAPASYFKAVDAKDLDGTLAHFADDATLTVQTDRVTFNGVEEIRRLFADFMGAWDSTIHEITNIVVEPDAKKVATEQRVVLTGSTQGGDAADMHNCNFFDFNDEGKFSRVIIWMDGTNPLQ